MTPCRDRRDQPDYRRHCLAAREIAEEYFAAPRVGAALLKQLGV
jgi:hypothetical protein